LAIRKSKDALASAPPEAETFGLTAPALPAEPAEDATRERLEAAVTQQAQVIAARKDVVRNFGVQVRKAQGFCSDGLNDWLRTHDTPRVSFPPTGGRVTIEPTPPELPEGELSHYTDVGLRARFVAARAKHDEWQAGVRKGAIVYAQKGRVTEAQLNGFCDVLGMPRPVLRSKYEPTVYLRLHTAEKLTDEQAQAAKAELAAAAQAALAPYGEVEVRETSLYYAGGSFK